MTDTASMHGKLFQHTSLTRLSRAGRARSRGAFTFVELLIVMLVMGLLAAAAVPTFVDSLVFHRVESAARRVKADLQLARHTARLTSASQSVTFAADGYTLSSAIESLDVPGTAYTVVLTEAPYEIAAVAADFAGTTSITFDGYGKPTSGGNVTLTARNHRCIITLDAATGNVTIASSHARSRTPKIASVAE